MIPLNINNYDRVTNHLKKVSINNLFARSVIEKKISGKVFVDNDKNPKTFYIVHPYGMSLLFGDPGNPEFNQNFLDYSLNSKKQRNNPEWMQAYPAEWNNVLSDLYKDHLINPSEFKRKTGNGIIELNTRVNFKFNPKKHHEYKEINLPKDCEIRKTDKNIYNEMRGSVIPSKFWDSEEDFINGGVGFSLYCNQNLAATAYSAFIHDNKLEIGIETIPEYRGYGYAQLTCSALIDFCLKNNFEPVWACRLENTPSFKLAEKLGFEAIAKIPYYRLGK
ncbi:GNAT family N-acetyltransferase [Marinilabilia rubra]|uniref:GNAT family N-acetyltransferase n=1 Tax=Marinilabilia rubra TaxID=2162893 RepID=A0A2U2B5F1_9BACT|nr:GNAT family N-acetyltransferase [Marinilabilia rubra]PWD98264.1 GNAT family N-acetyltransferase [Marinilabilia rubra]